MHMTRNTDLRLSLQKFLNQQRELMRIIRALRAIWLLGPWRNLFVKYHQRFSKNLPLPRNQQSIFGELEVASAVENLKRNGFAPGLHVPDEQVREVLRFCDQHKNNKHRNPHLICDAVNQIAHDPKIIEVASQYLGTEPILYQTSLYWSHPPSDEKKRQRMLQQKSRFHYDVGDFRSLVVFIYLTDVDEECGPHVLIEGTHQKKDPLGLITRYLSDKKAYRQYLDRIRIIKGASGTGFFEDLTCYHKHAVGNQKRLMLTITYMLHRTPHSI